MTPKELAEELRLIAGRIDISNQPSRSMVASTLKKLLLRVAGRKEVLDQIHQAFSAAGVFAGEITK